MNHFAICKNSFISEPMMCMGKHCGDTRLTRRVLLRRCSWYKARVRPRWRRLSVCRNIDFTVASRHAGSMQHPPDNKCARCRPFRASRTTVVATITASKLQEAQMKGLICVLIVLICVQRWLVEGKIRNRVQKWQQRTWKTRFGHFPTSNWKFDAPVKKRSHRKNLYANARFGGLSQREIDMMTGNKDVPNGYSNFHYHFDDLPKTSSAGSVGQNHHNDKRINVILPSVNEIQKFRMKRFIFQNEDDDEAEPEHFTNDLSHAPFVFDTDFRSDKGEYPDDRGYSNDLADLDFVRDDETVDFVPLDTGPNQRYITVEENDPFPHAALPEYVSGKKNTTQKVQYTLIIHHGDGGGSREPNAGTARKGELWFYWSLLLWTLFEAV